MRKLIDVSDWQGEIDFAKVKASGIDSVIIRAGYGRGNQDDWFTVNMDDAILNGMNIGIYWFSYAYTEAMAAQEARYCAEIIAPYKDHINLPVYFDWEYDSMRFAQSKGVSPGKTLITCMHEAFCEGIKALGYKPGYYCNRDYLLNYINVSQLPYSRWFAWYNSDLGEYKCDIWQYSDKGGVNGVEGRVDMNYIVNDRILDGQPAPEPPKKSNEEIAKEVWEGKWGDGEERYERLTAAGYDYDVIQQLVNDTAPGEAEKPAEGYVVQPGDTLSEIAQVYNTTVAELMALNPQINNPNLIYVGQVIRVR